MHLTLYGFLHWWSRCIFGDVCRLSEKQVCFGQSSVNNSQCSVGSCCVHYFSVNNNFALKSSWHTLIPLVTWILCLYYKCHLFHTKLILLQQCVLTFYSLIEYGQLVYWNAAERTVEEDKQKFLSHWERSGAFSGQISELRIVTDNKQERLHNGVFFKGSNVIESLILQRFLPAHGEWRAF